MKTLIAFNGSPRKHWNTAKLLDKALEGAAAQGAATRLVELYDLQYQGCKSCFGCKTLGGKSLGRCALRDDLTPLLDEVCQADALLLGSPVYFWAITGAMKAFQERLLFPFYRYAGEQDPVHSLFPRTIRTGFIYTLGASEAHMKASGYTQSIALNEMFMKRVFGHAESMTSNDTYQFQDYAKVDQTRFDPEQKAAWRREQFPLDCQKAFELGARLVQA